MSSEIEEARRRAHEMLDFFREEYKRQCSPYLKILAELESLQPRKIYLTQEEVRSLNLRLPDNT